MGHGRSHDGSADLRFEERDGYLYAHASGEEDSLAVSLDYWTRVFEECSRREATRVLVEESFRNQLGTVDIFELCTRIPEMPAPPGLKIAFLDREPTHRELNEFGGTVALNRGIAAGLFESVESAEAWLRGS